MRGRGRYSRSPPSAASTPTPSPSRATTSTSTARGRTDPAEPGGVHVTLDYRPFDLEMIRRDFPILKREVHGKQLVYLDNAATSQRPVQVIAEITRFYRDTNANIHRGVHTLSMEATEQYEGVR